MMAKSVFIAVPDLVFRSKLRDAAQNAGAETSSASTPADVLERSRSSRPDVLVLDLGDERLEPFDLIRRLKAEPSLVATHIVGFFSHVRIDIRDVAKEAGCDVILPRSVVVSALAGILGGDTTGGKDEL